MIEPKKVRVQELTLLFMSVRELANFCDKFTRLAEDQSINLGAVFVEYLVKLKNKPFQGSGTKNEMVGSLLTQIFMHLGIRIDRVTLIRDRVYMDAAHLTSAKWLNEGCFWSFRDSAETHLLQLPQRTATDFHGELAKLEFNPDPLLVRNPANVPCRHAVPRGAPACAHRDDPLPHFPHIPDLPIRDHGDFQRIVFDALQAIWASVEMPLLEQWECERAITISSRSLSPAG